MKRLNIFTIIGVIFSLVWLFSQQYNLLNNKIEGICVSLGLTFIIFGAVTMNYNIIDISKKKNKLLYNKIITRNKISK